MTKMAYTQGSIYRHICYCVHRGIIFAHVECIASNVYKVRTSLCPVVIHNQCILPINLFPTTTTKAAYTRQCMGLALVQITACRLFGTKSLSKPMLGYCQLEQTSVKFWSKYKTLLQRKCIWRYRLRNVGHFVLGEMSWLQDYCIGIGDHAGLPLIIYMALICAKL